ncbi:MAG: Crp/Fnr family transcriptional regulator [Saprospiraceae bacterium]|nr:Crp/Fnr family transcriptional regulator [Saprospiraceae bacterium]MCB9325803.1 Crp/Fnr family transcriptional regulator [Lewinellaceae bacterium]
MPIAQKCDLHPESGENSCMNCGVKALSLLKDLTFEELELINIDRRMELFAPGEKIFEEGTTSRGLYCLKTGKVKIVRSGLLENDPIVALKKPVDFIGLKALVLEKNHASTAIALEPCSICLIERDHFLQVVQNNNDLSLKVMQLLSKELEEADQRMVDLTQKHLRGRMADALLLLLNRYGTTSDNKTLDIQMKRADMAALANMTQANAIRILSDFSKENLLEIEKREIKILQLERLQKISQLG